MRVVCRKCVPMVVTTARTGDEAIVSVDGDLDLTSVGAFHTAVDSLLASQDRKRLIVDLRDTDYIDSAGLEQLLVANRKLAARGERLRVRVLPGSQPQTVLTITGFTAVMDVEPISS